MTVTQRKVVKNARLQQNRRILLKAKRKGLEAALWWSATKGKRGRYYGKMPTRVSTVEKLSSSATPGGEYKAAMQNTQGTTKALTSS